MFNSSQKFPALKYRDFRLLWIGQLISVTGSQMQIVALNWHIWIITHSPAALGVIGLARFLPIVIFSLLGGSVADSHNRKKLMFLTQSIMAILSGSLAVLTITNTATPILIYLITFLAAATLSFDTPARQAIIPSLVDRRHLQNALSLGVIMFQTATILGPALAGVFIAKYGVGSVYSLNALSFSAVIAALFLMHATGNIQGEKSTVSFSSVMEGLKFVKSKTIIWSTMLLDFFSTFFASATALLPIFATQILHVGPVGLGFLYAAQSIGAVAAGVFIAHGANLKKQGIVLITSVALYGAATVLFGVSTFFVLSFIALFLTGIGDGVSTIIRNTIRQTMTPDYIRGRMTAINMIFFMGGPQLGEFEAGLLAAFVGAPLSVVIGGFGTLAVVGIVSVTVPVLRKYHGDQHLHA